MTILWRSWLTFAAVIFVVLLGFSVLSLLQHAALLSGLTRQRIAVVAETVGAAFRPIVDLGLPLSMMRNGDEVVERLRGTDPRIIAIHVFNPSGIVVYTTSTAKPEPMSRTVLDTQRLADYAAWSLETPDALSSGYTIQRKDGTPVGGVLVTYPKDHVRAAVAEVNRYVATLAAALWAIFSLIAYGILRAILAAPVQGVRQLAAMTSDNGVPVPEPTPDPGAAAGTHLGRSLLRGEIDDLASRLSEANRSYAGLSAELASLGPGAAEAAQMPSARVVVLQSPQTSLARSMARGLLPWAAALMVVAVLLLGVLTLRAVNRSVEPEVSARVALIGSLVSGNVQRAVSAGVPLDGLVGADRYIGDLLAHFPEIAYVAVATGRIVLAAGDRVGAYLDPSGVPSDVPGFPIRLDGKDVGYVLVDMNPNFVAQRFLDVFLDLAVVVMVTMLVAFEILVLMLSRTLTGPLDRLHHLLAMQAVGDFSKRVVWGARNAIDAISSKLSDRALRVNRSYAHLTIALRHDAAARLDALAARHRLELGGPARLIFPYFTDIRLALFLFVAADELPLSFMPIYARAAGNPWPWLDTNVLISLPLAGYLLAILLASPFARGLVGRYGHRRVLFAATLPSVIGQLGLAFATSALEIVAFRTLTGFGYAIVTLACQDYVLDVTAPGERSRTLALFTLVLFGGIFSGTALGGVLADRLGFGPVFLISAGLIAIAAVLIQRLLPGRDQSPAVAPSARLLPPLFAPMRNPRFAGLVLGIAIPANVLLQAFISYLVALVLDSLAASPGDIGRTLMSYFLVVALFSPVAARVTDGRVAPSFLALAGATLSGAALIPVALWPSQWTMLAAIVLIGVAHALVRGPQVSVALEIAEAELTELGPDAVLGALRTLERGGSILGLIGVAAIAGVLGYRMAILVVALLVLVGAFLFLISEFVRALGRARPG